MHEQLADGDVLLAVLTKLGKIFCDRVVHAKFSLLPELHDGRGSGDDFGERRTVKYRIQSHGLATRLDGAAAVGFAIHDVAVMADDYDRTGICCCAMASSMMEIEDREAVIESCLESCWERCWENAALKT